MKSVYNISDPNLKEEIGYYKIREVIDFKDISTFKVDTTFCKDLTFREMIVYNYFLEYSRMPFPDDDCIYFFRITITDLANVLNLTRQAVVRTIYYLKLKGYLVVLKCAFRPDSYYAVV